MGLVILGVLLPFQSWARPRGRGAYHRGPVLHERSQELGFQTKVPDWDGFDDWLWDSPQLQGGPSGPAAALRGRRTRKRKEDVVSTKSRVSESAPGSSKGASAGAVRAKASRARTSGEGGSAGQRAPCSDYSECSALLGSEIERLQQPVDCRDPSLRFLLLEFVGGEGVGSTLAMVAQGLGESLHSNRTLIYGPLRPGMLRVEFMGGKALGFDSDTPCGEAADSSLDCHLLPLSRCSLADILSFKSEFEEFAENPFDDRRRFKLMEARRGSPALHVAPPRYRHLPEADRWWRSQLVRYAFRLRPETEAAFEATRKNKFAWRGPVVGVHIRHSDLGLRFEYGPHAGARAYQSRPYFKTSDYLRSLRDAVRSQAIETPKTVFVASDNEAVRRAVQKEQKSKFWRDLGDIEWVFLDRYRNVHGAHTSTTLIALPHSAKVSLSAVPPRTRAENFRRMVREALEDIWFLSQSDYFFGTGSSHFTAVANALRGPEVAQPHFLDAAGLASGEYCPGLFHGTINGTLKLEHPEKRHQIMQERFLDRKTNANDFSAARAFRFSAEKMLYEIPRVTFDEEGLRWADASRSRMHARSTTPWQIQKDPQRLLGRIVGLVNSGGEYDTFWSYGLALTGWIHARDLFEKVLDQKLTLNANEAVLEQIDEILYGNIDAHRKRHCKPFLDLLVDPTKRVYLEENK